MRLRRRRQRRFDPRASPTWVRSLMARLQASFPVLSSYKEKDLVRLLRAVRHVERYSATDTRRGRPSRWNREEVISVAAALRNILERETSGPMSTATFVDHYLRILDFPADTLEALARGSLNLFEAEQLARITATRLQISERQAHRKRRDLLDAHLAAKHSGDHFRRRIDEFLLTAREPTAPKQEKHPSAAGKEPDLEDFDPYDTAHLFWEEIKQLGFAFRDIRREDLSDESIEELLNASQPIWAVLAKIQRRQKRAR